MSSTSLSSFFDVSGSDSACTKPEEEPEMEEGLKTLAEALGAITALS